MVSTTYVQFLKGALLVVFSTVLTIAILYRGFDARTGGRDGYEFRELGPFAGATVDEVRGELETSTGLTVLPAEGAWAKQPFVRTRQSSDDAVTVWSLQPGEGNQVRLLEAQTQTKTADGRILVNGREMGRKKGEAELHPVGRVSKLPDGEESTGPLGLVSFFSTLQESEVVLWGNEQINQEDGSVTTVYYQKPTPGSRVLRPGEHPRFKGIRSDRAVDKLDFLSLMLALFCGTASLPHILIRYYTVKDAKSARRSTIVGIASIGFFYILTLYLGLGAMTSGALDVTDSNMAAPLLAQSISELLFAIISAIAFTTVLGTVSGLILASAGSVSHDLLGNLLNVQTDRP